MPAVVPNEAIGVAGATRRTEEVGVEVVVAVEIGVVVLLNVEIGAVVPSVAIGVGVGEVPMNADVDFDDLLTIELC